MRNFCIGASVFCSNFLKSECAKEFIFQGLFDNDSLKWGTKKNGYDVMAPYFDEDISIYITVRETYHIAIIRQLLELGYRRFYLVIKKAEGSYLVEELDYRDRDFVYEKDHLVLLYFQKNSYSGIRAMEWMVKKQLVNTYGFMLKRLFSFKADICNYYDFATAKYIITECDWNPTFIVPATIIQMWHGFPLKTMSKMLVTYNENLNGGFVRTWNHYKYILSYGMNYNVVIAACFERSMTQFAVTGMPRNDLLFASEGRKNLDVLFPKSKDKKMVLYMPTFREQNGQKNGDEKGYFFNWTAFQVEKFKTFCRKYNIFFVFKLHPVDQTTIDSWCESCDCMGIIDDQLLGERCNYELLNGVDILITDYSSIYFDYMLLDRPIIFTNQDEEEYLANRGMLFEPLDFWRPGPLVNTMEDLQSEIVKVLGGEDSHREHRKQLMPFVHKYTDGNSTQRLFDLLKEDSEKTDEE